MGGEGAGNFNCARQIGDDCTNGVSAVEQCIDRVVKVPLAVVAHAHVFGGHLAAVAVFDDLHKDFLGVAVKACGAALHDQDGVAGDEVHGADTCIVANAGNTDGGRGWRSGSGHDQWLIGCGFDHVACGIDDGSFEGVAAITQ